MMNKNERSARFLAPIAISALLVMGFLFCQPDAALAQTNWSGGILNRAAEAIAAHSRTPQGPSSIQSKSGAKGTVTIQSVTAGQIPIFTTNNSADLTDSVITQLSGNIGIGIAAPGAKLQVDTASGSGSWFNAIADGLIMRHTNTVNGLQIMHGASTAFFAVNPDALGSGALGIGTRGALAFPIYFYTGAGILNGTASTSGLRMTIDGSGNVGIGIVSPNYPLTIKKDVIGDVQMRIASNAVSLYLGAQWLSGVPAIGTKDANPVTLATNNVERLRIDPAGNVGIGTTAPAAKLHVVGTATITGDVSTTNIIATGNITATGNIAANYQDVAEWVPASRAISAGTVVVVDADRSNHVLASTLAYDTRVAGVVSASPGVILGERGEGKVMVATTGRIRVKVDATKAPIRVGDLLVTSDKEGIAMRSQPLDLGGTPIHRPGTLIGKALEPLDKGVGEILVLLSLQ